MASMHNLSNINRLNDNNYGLWKVHMKSVFVYNDLWSVVDGSEIKTEENEVEWIRKDALALINISVTQGQLMYVKKANTSKEIWKKLEK